MTLDWRQSEKAQELREFIDSKFKIKKFTLGNLERELIIDFAAKEIEKVRVAGISEGREKTIGLIKTVRVGKPHRADEKEAYEIKKLIVEEMKATFIEAARNTP